jgi:Protein of unknown function (DUF1559)
MSSGKVCHEEIARIYISRTVGRHRNPRYFGWLALAGCPSDTGYAGNGLIHNDRNFASAVGYKAHPFTPGVGNYIGATGFGSGRQNAEENTGIFWGNSAVKFGGITDGTSNTLMAGERDTKNCRSGTWIGVRNSNRTGSRGVLVVVAHARAKLNESVLPWNNAPDGCGQGFSSLHTTLRRAFLLHRRMILGAPPFYPSST